MIQKNNHRLYIVIKKALSVSLLTTIFNTNIHAQSQDDAITKNLAHAPIKVIERSELLTTGLTDVGDILQRLPIFNGSPINSRTNTGGNGDVRVDLRGLGSDQTLVLIDGQRTVDNGDFQTIALVMIDKIEILPQSASAIYGANAVAGVINIITRKDFSGAEIEASYSDSFDTNNLEKAQASVIFGQNDDQGGFTFGLEYEDQKGAQNSDTPYAFLQNSYLITDPGAYNANGFNVNADYLTVAGSSRIPCGNFNLASGGTSLTINGNSPGTGDCGTPGTLLTPDDFRSFNGDFFDLDNDNYNYAPVNFIQTPYEKTNLFFNANRSINGVEVFSHFRYNHRTSAQMLAPLPYDTSFDPAPDLDLGLFTVNQGIPASNVYNPFGEDVVRARRRMSEIDRRTTQDIQQYQATLGLKGNITDTSWHWQASYNFGLRENINHSFGQLIGTRLVEALGPSFFDSNGTAVCGTPDNIIAGCVPLNLFGGPGTVTQEMLNYISTTLTNVNSDQIDVFNAQVNGKMFDLGAGAIDVLLGLEYRNQDSEFTPDSSRVVGNVTGDTLSPLTGRYDINSFYAGFYVPLINSEKTGVINLDINARHDDHSIVGGETSFQSTLNYQPTPHLSISLSHNQAYQEPNIEQLFTENFDTFPQAVDPCLPFDGFDDLTPEQQTVCAAQGAFDDPNIQFEYNARLLRGGNQAANHSSVDNNNINIHWQPQFLTGLDIRLDWWDLDIEGVLTENTFTEIIFSCLNSGDVNSDSCNRVVRNNEGIISFIDGTYQNSVQQNISGIDLTLNYGWQNQSGQFDLGLQYSNIIDYDVKRNGASQQRDFAGTFINDNVYIEDKAFLSAQWQHGDWQLNYQLQYLSGIQATIQLDDSAFQNIGSQVYNDISMTVNTPIAGSTLSVGINNFLDKDPVFLENSVNNSTQASTYRVFGRTWFMRWQMAF